MSCKSVLTFEIFEQDHNIFCILWCHNPKTTCLHAVVTRSGFCGLQKTIIWCSLVAQLVEQAPHEQRLCPCCSGPRFDSTLWPLMHIIPSLSLSQISFSNLQLSCQIKAQKAKNISLKKRRKKINSIFFFL